MTQAWNYIDGAWLEGNPPILGPLSHATWLSSIIFDGARAFEGVAPDLDLHCQRAVESAIRMGMQPPVDAAEIERLAWEGIARFPEGTALYIRPLFYCEEGWVAPDGASTRFVLTLAVNPMKEPGGFTAGLSTFRRPAPDQAPVDCKAACLYPMAGRALREAAARGFDNAVMTDPWGNVAEFATANLFMVKDGVVSTPAVSGTFLNGVTRQRVLKLLRLDGAVALEREIDPSELLEADEIFSTGNHMKVMPVLRYEHRDLGYGPVARRARALYWDFAHGRLPSTHRM
ncbi:branched-chain amino acid aminotransferase [Roseospira marina]|uniref:Probable branched-chain-amino-acid aminotransferase n=1 Tax=Roseospira marina TaxID=140057 RepID=A0A5M6IE21_9PROT|nr:branched-chain amino acid aminotransferase [Roseospira marina]KAA5606009.1 branched-chain amino acid aminotransferase [Roseospira marina]MBB4313137.1 branched-chain amino acid aminotransferase [Roseospira marina]MBB5086122.1 branched-chain amino acid aminotransferase [Roseospira marina]